MLDIDPKSFRYRTLDAAKSFKSSWIELGQYLFMIYRDKLFRDWGYLTFEAYCAKEVGIRQTTAVKLLKSYSFLEREEPAFLKESVLNERTPERIPSYEAVNSLRLAKERVPEDDYADLKEEVLDKVREEGEVKKKLRYLLKNNKPKPDAKDAEDRKTALVRRLLTGLKKARNDMAELSFPDKALKKADELIDILSGFSGQK